MFKILLTKLKHANKNKIKYGHGLDFALLYCSLMRKSNIGQKFADCMAAVTML